MPPKTPSWAWKHMRRDFAEGGIGCLLCDRKFAAKTGASSLACHLEGAHSLNPSTTAGSGGGEKRQQEDSDIRDAKILKKNSPDRVEQLLVLWARRGLAYDLLSDPDFKAIFGACLPSNFRRENIPAHMAALKVKLTDDLREQIQGYGASMTFDAWTNHGDKWVNIMAHIATAGSMLTVYLTSFPVEKSDAKTVAKCLQLGHDLLRGCGACVVAVALDNFSGCVAGATLYGANHPYVYLMKCAAHSIQLAAREVMELEPLKSAIHGEDGPFRRYANHFQAVENRNTLIRVQETGICTVGPEEPRAPQQKSTARLTMRRKQAVTAIKAGATRWDSTLRSMARMIRLEPALPFCGLQILPGEWVDISFATCVMKKFQIATDMVQKECATLMDAEDAWETAIIESLKDMAAVAADDTGNSSESGREEFCRAALSVVRARKAKHLPPSPHVSLCRLLIAGRPRAQQRAEGSSDDVAQAADFCKGLAPYIFSQLGDDDATAAEKGDLAMKQLSAYVLGGGRFVRPEAEAAAYSFWSRVAFFAPELAKVATVLMGISASEAASERGFSHQATIRSKKRNRMLAPHVQDAMFARCNYARIRPSKSKSPEAAAQHNAAAAPPSEVVLPVLPCDASDGSDDEESTASIDSIAEAL